VEPQRLAASEEEFASRGHLARFWLMSLRAGAWITSRALSALGKDTTSGFDLSALAAGEFHPLGQSSATEAGSIKVTVPVTTQVSLGISAERENVRGPSESARPG
jgi:hypothetical protein